MTAAEIITSPANPRIKQAAALRDADDRRATGLTLVDGRRELARAEASGAEIVEAFVDARRLHEPATAEFGTTLADWVATLAARGTRVASVSEKAFERIAFGGRNEGVVGVVRFGSRPLTAVSMAADRPVFVIEGVEKPGNLGAILRTADAAGVGGVIVCDARTDVANPAGGGDRLVPPAGPSRRRSHARRHAALARSRPPGPCGDRPRQRSARPLHLVVGGGGQRHDPPGERAAADAWDRRQPQPLGDGRRARL
jgi:hypothetical protein